MAENTPRLLVIEDEIAVRRAVKRLIEKVAGFEVIDCGSAEAGLDLMEQHDVDAVLVDQGLPGITGLWQISGRSDLKSFDDVVRHDLYYIQNWSLALDIEILLKTVGVVLRSKGAY
jgi:ActR/RegA family two-component response regulator